MDREQPTDEQKLGLLERVRQDGDTEALDELLQLNDFSKAALFYRARRARLVAEVGWEIFTGATWKAALSQALFATIRAIPAQPGGEIDTAGAEAHCKRYGLEPNNDYELLYQGHLRPGVRDYLERGWLDGQTQDQYESGNALDDPYEELPDDVVDAIISREDIDRWVYIVFEPLAVGKSFTRIEQYRDDNDELWYREVLTDFGKAWGDRPRFVGGFWHELPEETVEQEYRARRRWQKYLLREAVSIHDDANLEDGDDTETLEAVLSRSATSPIEMQRRFRAIAEDACLELAGGDEAEADRIFELVTAQLYDKTLEGDGKTPLQAIAEERGMEYEALTQERKRKIEKIRQMIPDPIKYLFGQSERVLE